MLVCEDSLVTTALFAILYREVLFPSQDRMRAALMDWSHELANLVSNNRSEGVVVQFGCIGHLRRPPAT